MTGFEEVRAALQAVPITSWVAHTGVAMADVERAVDMILAATSMVVRVELGIQQSRHSTLNSYLEKLRYLFTGNFGKPGANGLHTRLQPLFRDCQGERSSVTGQEIIGGLLPTNRFADEVLSDDPRRVRAVCKAREAAPILRAMARFGMELLPPPPRAASKVRPETAAHGAITPYYDAAAAAGIDEVYRLVVDGRDFTFASARGGRLDPGRAPDLVLTAPAHALVAARRGETTLADSVAAGAVAVAGSKRALKNFQRIFQLR